MERDLSSLFGTLADEHRRLILTYLCETDSLRIPEDVGNRSQSVARQGGRSLAIELYHRDLPRLEDERLVEWDRSTSTVTRGPDFGDVEPVIRLLAANADRLPGGWP